MEGLLSKLLDEVRLGDSNQLDEGVQKSFPVFRAVKKDELLLDSELRLPGEPIKDLGVPGPRDPDIASLDYLLWDGLEPSVKESVFEPLDSELELPNDGQAVAESNQLDEGEVPWSLEITKAHVDSAVKAAKAIIAKNGLPTDLQVKIKPTKQAGWVALYRSGSAVVSRPIFWVNPDFGQLLYSRFKGNYTEKADYDHDVFRNLVDTLLHEYGHAIADMIRLNFRMAGSSYQGKSFSDLVHADEEEFAENMVKPALERGTLRKQPWAKYIPAEWLGESTQVGEQNMPGGKVYSMKHPRD